MSDHPEISLIDERAARRFVSAMMDAIDIAAEAGLPRDRMLSAMRQMRDHVERIGNGGPRVLFADVLTATAVVAELTEADLLGQSQKRDIAWPRQVACHVGAARCQISQSEIARRLNRDSTSVNHALRAVEARVEAGCVRTQELVEAVSFHAGEIAKRRVPGAIHAR